MEPSENGGRRLTVAMIVRNCAQPLAATIDSVRAIADEIVVLDTGSTDDTPVVAAAAGAALHRRGWDDDFAAARNTCLDKATGDWILWLDAGETLAAAQAAELREFLRSAADPRHAYTLNVALPPVAGQVGAEQIARLRLHPRHSELRFAGRIRERMDAALAAQDIRQNTVPFVIHRGPAEHDPATKTGRAQRNIRVADLELAEQGPTADLHNVLGEAFQALGDGVRAAQHYRRALDLAERASREHLEAFYGLLTCLDSVTADRSDQLSLCMLALEHFPLDAQLLVALGGYLQSLDQLPLAIRSFDVAFRHGQIEPQIWHLSDIREIAAACAATALAASGDHDQARTLLAAAVRTYPTSQRLALQLIDLLVAQRLRDEALAIVGQLQSAADRGRLATAVRGACLAQHGDWPAAVDLLQAALLEGCEARFCYRWLIAGWLALDRPLDAQSALRVWQAAEPTLPEIAELSAQVADQLARSMRVDSADQAQPAAVPRRIHPLTQGPSRR